MHTEVRWLSKGNSLKRFYSLFGTVVEFFKASNPSLSNQLKQIKADVAYLADIFSRLNELSLKLQGDDLNLIKAKTALKTFLSTLQLLKRNVARRELYQFPSLFELETSIPDDDLLLYCAHLEQLYDDMSERFKDLLSLEIPDWIINPFLDINYEETGIMEEELISLINDIELKPKF